MIILKSTHEAAMAEKDAEIAGLAKVEHGLRERLEKLRADYSEAIATIVEEQNHSDKLRHDAAVVGKALNEVLAERDAARDELAKFKSGLALGAAASAAKRRAAATAH